MSSSSVLSLVSLTVGNDGHVTNVLRVVHETTDLFSMLAAIPMCVYRLLLAVLDAYLFDGEAVETFVSKGSNRSFAPSMVSKLASRLCCSSRDA